MNMSGVEIGDRVLIIQALNDETGIIESKSCISNHYNVKMDKGGLILSFHKGRIKKIQPEHSVVKNKSRGMNKMNSCCKAKILLHLSEIIHADDPYAEALRQQDFLRKLNTDGPQ
jgi:hypothetical protein